MAINDLDISEFLNNYRNKLKEEKKRLDSFFQPKEKNKNTLSVEQKKTEEAVNNIRQNDNHEILTQHTSNQHYHTDNPTKTTSSDIENIHMLRQDIRKNNKENDLKGEEAFFGFGEYEKRRQKFLEERRLDYKEYLEKQKQNYLNKLQKNCTKEGTKFNLNDVFDNVNSTDINLSTTLDRLQESKSVQTSNPDISLPKPDVPSSNIFDIKNNISDGNSDKDYFDMNVTRPNQLAVKIDKVQIGTQNIIVPGYRNSSYDSINELGRDTSPKARYLAGLKHTYLPSFTKTNENPIDEDYLSKKLKWEKVRQHEKYHEELRQQIEEKQKIAFEMAERERYQEAALTRRVEKQLQQLRKEHEDEKANQDFKENHQRYVESKWNGSKNLQIQRGIHNFPYDHKLNGFYQIKSENSYINKTNNHKLPYSCNIPENSIFSTASTSKLNKEIYYSEEKKKFSNSYSKDTYIHSGNNISKSKSIMDDSFSIPILRAKSPIKDNSKYINKIANTPNSPAMQQVEAKWMVPAVQKNIIKRSNLPSIGESKNVLTQLGAIRLQLQQEQLRLNQTLKHKATQNSK